MFQITFSKLSQVTGLNQGQLCHPWDMWQCLGTFLIVPVGGVLLASSGYKSGMLVDILQCTRQLPTTKNFLTPSVNMLRLRTCNRAMDIAHNPLPRLLDTPMISGSHQCPTLSTYNISVCLFVCVRNLFSKGLVSWLAQSHVCWASSWKWEKISGLGRQP